MQLVIFRVDSQRYALPLADVEHVIRAVAVTALPAAPALVLGAIDVRGSVIPVLNLRRRLHLPEREIGPDDQFLIARTQRRVVALVIDEAQAVSEFAARDMIGIGSIVSGLDQFRGAVRLDDGLLLIQDLEKFLSEEDERILEDALSGPK